MEISNNTKKLRIWETLKEIYQDILSDHRHSKTPAQIEQALSKLVELELKIVDCRRVMSNTL